MTAIRTAVIGYGYWGPNLVRNVIERPDLEFAGLCELDATRAAAFSAKVPGATVFTDLAQVVSNPDIDAVLVATPPHTHHPIVAQALRGGKHVLVEKPLAKTSAQARDLIEIAAANNVTLMPGHTFLYSPPVNKVKQLIESGTLGEIYFVTSSRMNLGKYQPDGVVCDLAPHDLSILLYLLEQPVVSVSASARSVFQDGVPEAAFLTLTFANGAMANVQMSWLAPRKVREMTIVGSQQMVQYDDTANDEAIRVYDRGMDFKTPSNFGEHQLSYRSGDIIIPRVDAAEPLSLELADFANSIRTGERPRSHAELGYEIVVAIEAAEESLRRNGEPVHVNRMAVRAAA